MAKHTEVAKQVGRGSLSLLAVLALIALTIFLTRMGHANLRLPLTAAVAFGGYLAGSRWIERRPPPELSLAGSVPEFAIGFALGVLLFSIVMGLLGVIGLYHPQQWGSITVLASGALVSLCQGVLEEVVFRGFIFRLMSLATGTWIALILSAALFGLLHAANPGTTLFSTVAIALEAGVLLGAGYVLTGRLWLPIALHAAWNFAEGSVFGMSVSGGEPTPSLITGTLDGRWFLTGGAFGPEASVFAVAVCLTLAIVLLWRAVHQGRIELPAWKREASTNQ